MVELASVMGTKAYKSASADKQAKLLNDVNTYAYEVAKASVLGKGAAYQWVQKTLDVQESIGLPTSAVIIYRDMLSDEKSSSTNSVAWGKFSEGTYTFSLSWIPALMERPAVISPIATVIDRR